jgi:hypothetical protein
MGFRDRDVVEGGTDGARHPLEVGEESAHGRWVVEGGEDTQPGASQQRTGPIDSKIDRPAPQDCAYRSVASAIS